jgi:mannose-1-phosphate guanylyltransferase/mannose-6-phosphate isomerase
MKCIVLAGGIGDVLWPLSRQQYPKQFMPFRAGRSMLQENIVRNMTFCDEFIITTNKEYRYIVESQMRAIQGVKYRIISEEGSLKTALPVMVAAMLAGRQQDILVIRSDTWIEGSSYQEDMIESIKLISQGRIILHGVRPDRVTAKFSYVIGNKDNVQQVMYRPESETAARLIADGNCFWNIGVIICSAATLIDDVKKVNNNLYAVSRQVVDAMPQNDYVVSTDGLNYTPVSIDEAYLCRSRRLYLLECHYSWNDIGSFDTFAKYIESNEKKNTLVNHSRATVINEADNKLVVVNGLDDAVVVNTEDALYVTDRDSADDIRNIILENHDHYVDFFDYNTTSYREWGKHELLKKGEGYKVKKVTVAPGMEFALHKHEYRSEQWTVVKGTPTITLGTDEKHLTTRDYHMGECISVPIGTVHKVFNNTPEDVEIVEVAVGLHVVESDVIRLGNTVDEKQQNQFIKLSPAFKDYLWGGTRIRDELGKDCELDVIAESWELSAHADGVSKVASGAYKGMYFNDYLAAIGKDKLGWKCQHYDRFPILIKFIDAANPLSIQIHPDDEYALKNEGEYGKNEMWYIMDCDEGAFIYYGTRENISKDELRRRIENNTILEVLNKVYVHKGDVFYVKAGTIHAIGGGILICEIQQSSNCTYRMYDYDRRDKLGNPRQLHIDKAIDVVNTAFEGKALLEEKHKNIVETDASGNSKELLVQCKYFECSRYSIRSELKLPIDEASFRSVMIVEGTAVISDTQQSIEVRRGDSIFVPAKKDILTIAGCCDIIVTHL